MKKFFAIILTFAMLMSMSVTAFATESKDVTATYTPTTTTTATITGLSISIDGTAYTKDNTSESNPAIIKSTSTVKFTVYGTNLASADENYVVYLARALTDTLTNSAWTVSSDGTEATRTVKASYYNNSTDSFELKYSTTGYNDWTNSGLWVIYQNDEVENEATITDVSISIDGTEYTKNNTSESNPAIIKSTSTVQITVHGTYLQNATNSHKVLFNGAGSSALNSGHWSFSDDGTTASRTMEIEYYENKTTAFELTYSNDGGSSWNETGVWAISEFPTYTVTGYSDDNGNKVTADLTETVKGATVTLTVTSANGYKLTTVTVTDESGNAVSFDSTGAASGTYTFTMPASAVTVTATFSEIEVISATITWGSMSFTYDDTVAEGATEENGWTCESGANNIVVENTGETAITAQAAYESYEGYESITGSFDPASEELAIGKSYTFTLELSGKPTKVLSGEKIGKVTITINEAAEG